jgi:hypothetical protein
VAAAILATVAAALWLLQWRLWQLWQQQLLQQWLQQLRQQLLMKQLLCQLQPQQQQLWKLQQQWLQQSQLQNCGCGNSDYGNCRSDNYSSYGRARRPLRPLTTRSAAAN